MAELKTQPTAFASPRHPGRSPVGSRARASRGLAGLLVALVWLGCGGAQAPRPAFNLSHFYALAPALTLPDGRWFDGGAAPVVSLPGAGAPVIVTPVSMWMRAGSTAALPDTLAAMELYTWEVADARRLVVGTRVVGGVEGGILRVAVDTPVDPSVRVLTLAREPPREADVLFLLGCAAPQPPCEPAAHAVEVASVGPQELLVVPLDPAHTHAHGGAPVLTRSGELVGILLESRRSDRPELILAPPARIGLGR
jgi:hypothetical protein